MGPIQVLSLSTLYPNPDDPGAGLFIRARLQALAALTDLRVMAPVALLRYTGDGPLWREAGSSTPCKDGPIMVLHPRWVYPPASGVVTAFFLFGCLLRPCRRLRREFPFQLIDAHFGHPEGVAAGLLAAVLGCPFVVTLRGSEIDHAAHRYRRKAMSWMLRRAGRVFTVSDNLRQLAISLGASGEKVVTIPNGVDAATFFPRDGLACRTTLGLSEGRKLILAAGHLIRLKGHHHIIRAVRALVDRGVEVELAIAGGAGKTGSYEPEIRGLVGELGLEDRVRFLGQLPPANLAEWMCAADVFCLASSREGWPNVVNEALACGTPVVATTVGAVPQMIPSEQYGLQIPLADVEKLDVSLARALEMQWNRQAIAAWGRARSWEEVARDVAAQMQATLMQATVGKR